MMSWKLRGMVSSSSWMFKGIVSPCRREKGLGVVEGCWNYVAYQRLPLMQNATSSENSFNQKMLFKVVKVFFKLSLTVAAEVITS